MIFHVLTLFPNMFDAPLNQSIIGRGQEAGLLQIHKHQIRDFTKNRQKQVDDYPYGGGGGLIMTPQPLHDAWKHAKAQNPGAHTIYFSPKGKTFTQETAKKLLGKESLILVCGHYEGIDQRFIDHCVDEEISMGDFVLTGGEIPALALIDATARLIPGVLSSQDSFTEESHWQNTLEHPHYTRPPVWEGSSVPQVLQNGVHSDIAHWRRKMSLLETLKRRPDLFDMLLFSKKDLSILDSLKQEINEAKLKKLHTKRITVRPLTLADSKRITEDNPVAYLAKRKAENIYDFAIYAEGKGFCGHIWYEILGNTAKLDFNISPHAKGKGIVSFSLAFVCDHLFSQTGVVSCTTSQNLSPNFIKRFGFSPGDEGFLLPKEVWLNKR